MGDLNQNLLILSPILQPLHCIGSLVIPSKIHIRFWQVHKSSLWDFWLWKNLAINLGRMEIHKNENVCYSYHNNCLVSYMFCQMFCSNLPWNPWKINSRRNFKLQSYLTFCSSTAQKRFLFLTYTFQFQGWDLLSPAGVHDSPSGTLRST